MIGGKFSANHIELFAQGQAVQRIYRPEKLDGAPRLVTLQMPDQVPTSIQIVQQRMLALKFLHPIFPEIPQSKRGSRSNRLSRKSLRHADDGHILRRAPDPRGRL